ncbi:MAG: YlxR family protein [Clostridia bacterium]|nr:YlxR family protein [Clostridia bacterium]
MVGTKKEPQRTCIACREMKDKKDLIRIVKNPDGVSVDRTGKASGRGAYICNSVECLNKCVKSRALNRAFKENVPNEVYEKLKEEFNAE